MLEFIAGVFIGILLVVMINDFVFIKDKGGGKLFVEYKKQLYKLVKTEET